MIRFAVVLGVGYVLGARPAVVVTNRLAGTYKAVTENPATKAVHRRGAPQGRQPGLP